MNTIALKLLAPFVLILVGCPSEALTPRYGGEVVAHVDSYNSGTGTRHELTSSGDMACGFNYRNSPVSDWEASVRWTLLPSYNNTDAYELSWKFVSVNGRTTFGNSKLSFDGKVPAKLLINDQLTVSIEPQETKRRG